MTVGRGNFSARAFTDYEPLIRKAILPAASMKANNFLVGFRRLVWKIGYSLLPTHSERVVYFDGRTSPQFFPPNVMKNQKFNMFTVIPCVLYEQFRYFFNLFYLLVALAQFIPQFKVGPLFTYLAPLSFVLAVSLGKAAYDDYKRYLRDKELNSAMYDVLEDGEVIRKQSQHITVGDTLILHAEQRVPCDLILIRASDNTTFIRTDQLDGETDWKLRRPLSVSQNLESPSHLQLLEAHLIIEPPRRDIYDFVGTINISTSSIKPTVTTASTVKSSISSMDIELGRRASSSSTVSGSRLESLTLENTIWSSCVVTSGPIYGIAIYTGNETRSSMNTSKSKSKLGLFDYEVNAVAKSLFLFLTIVASILTFLKGLSPLWFIHLTRFVLLLSNIIPISLRVNLDLAKAFYSYNINNDAYIPGTVVRNSNIPEELGRIDMLMTDKTGTLTCNIMKFKRLLVGRVHFTENNMDQVKKSIENINGSFSTGDTFDESIARILIAITTCHKVTPTLDQDSNTKIFQSASPDEIALVQFASTVGLELEESSDDIIVFKAASNGFVIKYIVLYQFPFSSETKKMGCIVQDFTTGAILFFAKGADCAILPLVDKNDAHWLNEECENYGRVGLRTLVFCYRQLSKGELAVFAEKFATASVSLVNRAEKIQNAIESIERNMNLLGMTGVEDMLRENVPRTLEAIRQAGIASWMLTGDKIETAICVATSCGLLSRQNDVAVFTGAKNPDPDRALARLQDVRTSNTTLIFDGSFVSVAMKHFPEIFIKISTRAPSVICCRCSPTQKAELVEGVQRLTGKRVAAIGDGGNDVSMIQAANCGIGIVGKEGKQASLAADFSLTEFSYIHRLILLHGRLSYERSSTLSQFVMHRGLVIATIQAIFSAVFYFIPMAIYQGWLAVGYATYYTMFPVFSLVLDYSINESVVFLFPELYVNLRRGRKLCLKTLLGWVWTSVYQGGTIMLGTLILFETELANVVSITFTSLILAELLNVAAVIKHWHILMVTSELASILIYLFSIWMLPNVFNIPFMLTRMFWLKVSAITVVAWAPLFIRKVCMKCLSDKGEYK